MVRRRGRGCSRQFVQQPLLQNLRWVRTFGNVVFIVSAVAMAMQVVLGLVGRPPKPRPLPWPAEPGLEGVAK